MDDLELRVAWQQYVLAPSTEFESHVARYREPHRHYHGVRHLQWVIRHIRQLALPLGDAVDLAAVIAAGFFHDAVYDPRRADNEPASARLATTVLGGAGWAPPRVTEVAAMIAATAHHADVVNDDRCDLATAVLVAADLAVLGADAESYRVYQRGVRREYAHVTDDQWRTGRAEVLRSFVERAYVFPPSLPLDAWEHRARANIAAELAGLTATG